MGGTILEVGRAAVNRLLPPAQRYPNADWPASV